ncbi:hypothetical protein F543_11800 [Bibersteinia trehalosi USDA-ARS-USMARC-189]|uniref:Uncharacterized protein n=2 Tax=Bibersteinia trehalosi TaxID=47735 RepID=W0R6M7_BIBTR|nr:hypothetical protein WQG_11650 [Bibersteinia trehalosi USDA-ARS-USMARC-192]AHG84044.1 hypothetical protein F543_11800 [Bibersteinia trehalosi USDA-ARS-USMARC-189]AHG86431.1 hypothetical protein F544_12030 [Bibersteinia trehalosi USDA-ARS-USMARC-190]
MFSLFCKRFFLQKILQKEPLVIYTIMKSFHKDMRNISFFLT